MKKISKITKFNNQYFHRITNQNYIKNTLFYFLIISIFFSCTYTLMLTTNISIGDFPSYTNIFKFNFNDAQEIHRYRIFVPFFARFINEIFNYINLDNIYTYLDNKHNIEDSNIRLSFYIVNLIGTLITCTVIKSYLKPLKPNFTELILIIVLFLTSKGIIISNSHPAVDTFEIAILSIACLQLQRGNYFNVILIQIFSWPIKETSMFYIFLILIYFLLKETNINQIKKYLLLFTSLLFLFVASLNFELIINGLIKFHLNKFEAQGSINVVNTALTHLMDLINSLSVNPFRLLLGSIHSIISNISLAIIVLSIFGYALVYSNKKLLMMEDKYNYKNMLFLLVMLLFAG